MISKMIVENFEGYIDFASVYKKGSVFYFTFKTERIDEAEMATNNFQSLTLSNDNIPQFRS